MQTKIYLGPQGPFWPSLFLPLLTDTAPFSSFWCLECQLLFSHRTFAYVLLSPGKNTPRIPLNLFTSLSRSLQFSPKCTAQLPFPLGWISLLLCSHPTQHFSLVALIKVVIDLGTFCTYICMTFNKKAHIIGL